MLVRIIFAVICVIAILFFIGVIGKKAPAPEPSGTPVSPDPGTAPVSSESPEVLNLLLRVYGTMAWEDAWEIKDINGEMTLSHYSGNWPYDDSLEMEDCLEQRKALTDEEYEELCDLLERIGMRSWDGYSGSDPDVLDGGGFSLDVLFKDGESIWANGENAYPDGYGEMFSALTGLLAE